MKEYGILQLSRCEKCGEFYKPSLGHVCIEKIHPQTRVDR